MFMPRLDARLTGKKIAGCQADSVDDIESPPARKKCRITSKIRPRTPSENKHADGDAKTFNGPTNPWSVHG
ncbi:hypothetical protein FOXG_19700 [Fusarium oxysporum f. sp. lycopersici 4287]|uniref:Uncharacterized protein n=1 Tax=Fusarium oxysporum f. sp. lycopersici (strain 4287 / CBS 123668 / FGSC 9935 / NRRL 34936) TaxID=426428 RepID=A0A0J9UZL3_FUSO4|nr:hypothetical protein FOXG_19326 [Fusarium oxysporum f. sp. lycopersici 4287]XP_018242627.1 hypothetical protein FOXG_19335 [Fusarium oxysporum f. sp. lycopersici 4287]XP_018244560.1 hypothetical protein FOXG_19700 [Fusarium oxysporum f. sp. lycopersici 4287]KNB04555.1 hypothetical protein FOXG_19326 [Fusarium oxysporum f. sp. lycopersici 4287]KNB04582.1 hypothetical protein FOXG_19335 [Fusarium oxysporum f. sp. lycopersici 4287]KNB06515.1 hypothetical protein FOXG_19700 [Fusarium oxysporum 